jgi:hypothetical protein
MDEAGPTLTEALAAKGIQHKRDELSRGPYSHTLRRGDAVIGSFTAVEAWEALKAGEFD